MSHRNLSLAFIAGLGLAGAVLQAPRANAADLDLDPGYASVPLQEQKVEFGTGWYIRGDMAVTRTQKVTSSGVTFDTTDPAAIPVPPNLSFSPGSNVGYTASLGAGYQFNRWFRSDVIADFHEPIASGYQGGALLCPGSFNAAGKLGQEGCSPHYSGSLNSYDVLVNGYLDLGTWYTVTPYVGAGVGVAFGHYNSSVKFTQSDGSSYDISPTDPTTGTTYHEDFDTATSGNYYNFAFALMAGVTVDLTQHAKLDIGYRYLNSGHLPTSTGGASLYEQEVRGGLRYMIDN